MANEKRLIDAGALMKAIKSFRWISVPGTLKLLFDYLQTIIKTQPTVDAVEVVRCEKCRFCKEHPTSDKVKMCTNEQQWATECYPLVHDDDFCSYGERRSDENP